MTLAASSYPLLNLFWTTLWIFALVLWFWLLFRVFADLFGRHDIGGWGKFLWTVFVIFVPLIGVFSYLIAEGRAMSDRGASRAQAAQQESDEYIRSVVASNGHAGNGHAGNGHAGSVQSSTDEISHAKELLDSGAITSDEFARIKERALS